MVSMGSVIAAALISIAPRSDNPGSRKHDRIGCDETGFVQHLWVVHASERLLARGTFLSDRRIAGMRARPLSATLRPFLGKERATCGSPSAHALPGIFWPSLV
jgi:hypothetical protein